MSDSVSCTCVTVNNQNKGSLDTHKNMEKEGERERELEKKGNRQKYKEIERGKRQIKQKRKGKCVSE